MTALERLQRDYPDFLEGCTKPPTEEDCEAALSGLAAMEAIAERLREREAKRLREEQRKERDRDG